MAAQEKRGHATEHTGLTGAGHLFSKKPDALFPIGLRLPSNLRAPYINTAKTKWLSESTNLGGGSRSAWAA